MLARRLSRHISLEPAFRTNASHRMDLSRRLPMLLVTVLVLMVVACSDDDPSVPHGDGGDYLVSAAIGYDGSFGAPLGPFHITDLRSKMVEVEGDSVDIYAAMEDYETRNLTVYYPSGANARPVVVFIHGGAWVDGYMEWYTFVPESFTGSAGHVTVVINYRLTSESVFPVALCPTRASPAPDPSQKASWYPDDIADCADAFRWVVDHIAEYGGDPQQIFVFGQSAGAHLASLLATHDDYAALRGHIRGVISMSGAYLLKELNEATFDDALDQTFGDSVDDAALDEASPSTYVVAGVSLPPFLVMYCEDDLPSLTSQALVFSERLEQMGQSVETEYLPGYGHVSEMQAIEFADEPPTERILQFIEDQLE